MKKKQFALVIWKGIHLKNEFIILYNMTDYTSESLDLNDTRAECKISSHNWFSIKELTKANEGKSVTLLDTWKE